MDGRCVPNPPRQKQTPKMLDITNHIAKKYHIEFGAAKCKVVRIGRGPKSPLVLNGTILEEVPTYKYLGDMINNKGDLTAHIKEIEGKVIAATQCILTDTGNKEFKGMKMQAIWQLTDAVIIPIITYGAESWDATKKEIEEIQKILNNCLKTILCLPQGTPTQILLAETGYLPIQYYIYKIIMQWHRIQKKPETALIKKITQGNNSTWKEKTIKIMNELKISEETSRDTKPTLKKELETGIAEHIKRTVENEALAKSKVREWALRRADATAGKRPEHMNKLSRKQCSAIVKLRSRMIPAKANHKNQHKDTICRFC